MSLQQENVISYNLEKVSPPQNINKKEIDPISNDQVLNSGGNPQEHEFIEDTQKVEENLKESCSPKVNLIEQKTMGSIEKITDENQIANHPKIVELTKQPEVIELHTTNLALSSPKENFQKQIVDPSVSELIQEKAQIQPIYLKEESQKKQDPQKNQNESPIKQENNPSEKKSKSSELNSSKQQEEVSQQAQNDEPMYTVEKRLLMANELKDKAREIIKQKKYQEALIMYQQALDLTNPTYFRYVSEEIKKDYQILSINLLNNLSFCYFYLGNYIVSAQISEQTLIIDPKNLKAMYRRAVCFKNLQDYERAFEIIKDAVKNGGNQNKEIYGEYEQIKELYKDYLEKNKQREKQIYGRMMNSGNEQRIKEEQEKKKKEEEETLQVASQTQNLVNSIFFFGSSAFSFLIASKVFKIDVTHKTGFSLAGSLAASLYGTYHFQNKVLKSIMAISAFTLFGYMVHRKSIAS